MPVYPMYFQTLSPQQANPFGYGMLQGAQTANQLEDAQRQSLQNQLISAQIPYAPQMAQQELLKSQLGNQLTGVQLKYAPEDWQSQIALRQAQASQANAQVPFLTSEAALNTASIPYVGMKYIAPMVAAQARYAQAGANWSNNFRQWIGTPEGQQWVKNNPQAAQSVLNTLNTSANVNNNFGVSVPGNQTNYTNPNNLPVLPGGTVPSSQVSQQNGLTITPQQVSQLQNLATNNPNAVAQIQQAASDSYQTKMTTPQQRQQIMYGNVVEGLLRDNQSTINNAIQFAGLAGKAGSTIDKYAQSVGQPGSEAYQDYRVFTNQIAPKIANELRRTYGGQATDYEGKLMSDIGNPINWNKNPQQTAAEFNQLISDLRTNTRAITQTPTQSMQTANQYANSPIKFGGAPQQGQQQPITKTMGGRTYTKINGTWYAQ